MRFPDSLATLADYGIIDEVVRPLMSGKEAQIYLVLCGDNYRVAKVYKEAQNRSFKHRTDYTEGRKVRNTRDQRAIAKRSKHGRAQDEAAWRSTEVDMIYKLQAAGVRVPVPYNFVDGVLVMELVTDVDGQPAPRLGDLRLSAEEATNIYQRLLREVVRMLCAGVVHGDLSEFNVLVGADGPVVIDFPQAIDAAGNQGARKILMRDVDNLHRFLERCVPGHRRLPYAQEMWELYESNLLTPETKLTGRFQAQHKRVDTSAVLDLIGDANRDEQRRRQSLGLKGGPVAEVPRREDNGRAAARGNSRPLQPSREQSASVAARPPAERQARGYSSSSPRDQSWDQRSSRAPGGQAFNGRASNGQAPNGQASGLPQSPAPRGQSSHGQHSHAQPPRESSHGRSSGNDSRQGPRGQSSQGPRGQSSQGPRGQSSQGPRGQSSQGPRGQSSQGSRGEFSGSRSTAAEPPRSEGSRGSTPRQHQASGSRSGSRPHTAAPDSRASGAQVQSPGASRGDAQGGRGQSSPRGRSPERKAPEVTVVFRPPRRG